MLQFVAYCKFSPNDSQLIHAFELSALSSSMSLKKNGKSKSIRDWHEVLGNCNVNDILSQEVLWMV